MKNPHKGFLFPIVLLWLLIPLYIIFPNVFGFIFQKRGLLGKSVYADISILLILFYAFCLFYFNQPEIKKRYLKVSKSKRGLLFFIDLIKAQKITSTSIFIGLAIGVILTFLTLSIKVFLLGQNLTFNLVQPLLISKYDFYLFVSILLVPLFEEILYRGILMNTVTGLVNRKTGIFIAVVFSSSIFAYIHPVEPEIKILLGLALSLLYILPKEKNLFPPIVAHIVSNVIVMFFG
jgi:membrane protease YdiL (CAAX protease family)